MDSKLPEQPSLPMPVDEKCDRCGNDLSHSASWLNLPYRKKYIVFCMICLDGLMIGFKKDIESVLNKGGE